MFKTPVKTWFASKVILFKETLEYWNEISICYGWHQALHLSSRVPVGQTWVVVKTIMNILLRVVKQCVLNQIQKY